MRSFLTGLLVILGLAAFAAYSALFIVHQNEQALVLEFGKPTRVIDKPGLNWIIPFVQTAEVFDKRIIEIDAQPQEVILNDKKRVVVDSFARYRIVDPLLYYQTVRDERVARLRLAAFVEAAMRRVLGLATIRDAVKDKREILMRDIASQVSDEARKLGVQIVDVRLKRIDVPQENRESIYGRMRTEREREAKEIRAQGEEESLKIRANADRTVTVIKAEAAREAETLRGDGDGERNRIFAEAFGQDPEFFTFYRSMQAYETGLRASGTRMVLSPDSDFFRYFTDPTGRAAKPNQ
jgi:membrane protease subunit HflC